MQLVAAKPGNSSFALNSIRPGTVSLNALAMMLHPEDSPMRRAAMRTLFQGALDNPRRSGLCRFYVGRFILVGAGQPETYACSKSGPSAVHEHPGRCDMRAGTVAL